ncbi:hypothetical protein RPATATE_0958 [Rickettsia parkeri str. Tate's Hell]|uniref:Uncharacterized protein n=1 Tax=Rickettsia parkeri str. Tate's Hell TaxID=1359189 RepID=A0ABR5DNI9_RICPA|nr:hypothetical protein RPAAT24_1564 [Rickettsia parkeri str. AT\
MVNHRHAFLENPIFRIFQEQIFETLNLSEELASLTRL